MERDSPRIAKFMAKNIDRLRRWQVTRPDHRNLGQYSQLKASIMIQNRVQTSVLQITMACASATSMWIAARILSLSLKSAENSSHSFACTLNLCRPNQTQLLSSNNIAGIACSRTRLLNRGNSSSITRVRRASSASMSEIKSSLTATD